MINKNYDRVAKADRKASPSKKAEILSSLQESVTEMSSPMFKITYKDSRGAKKTDIMRAKNSNLAKRAFNALQSF